MLTSRHPGDSQHEHRAPVKPCRGYQAGNFTQVFAGNYLSVALAAILAARLTTGANCSRQRSEHHNARNQRAGLIQARSDQYCSVNLCDTYNP
jgi:hypothetical protein